MNTELWRKCSSCKNPILCGQTYYVCSVSSCNGKRTGYVFCSVPCFERHLPSARHKDAGAVEMTAPKTVEVSTQETGPQRRIVSSAPKAPSPAISSSNEILIVASRLKDHINNRSGFNTSASVMNVLSDHVRMICERAIDNARADGRKTIMDKDFQFLKKNF